MLATGSAVHADASGSGVRVALIIANGNYPDANLPSQSAGKDADLLSSELGRYGFKVDLRKDLTRLDMLAAIDSFYSKVVPGSTALLYFNGIGIQVSHQTYLIPVNAQLWSEGDVRREGVSIDDVLSEISKRGARVKIVIIDASRRNPFERRFRAYSAGLAGIDAPEGSLVVYAAAPNKVMQDGNGDVSLFMNELVKELRTPDINAEEAMTQTRIGVSRASNGEEVPWVASSLSEPFYFGRTSSPPQKPPQKPVVNITPPVKKDDTASIPTQAPKPPKTETPKTEAPTTQSSKIIHDCPDCPELMTLPTGTYKMGEGTTPVDKPAHMVAIEKPFAIGITEVTFNQWNKCVAENGCKFRPDAHGGSLERPVTNVGWSDANEYVTWLSSKTGKTYRLPSEAEWEYAAHGGTTTPFYWGTTVGTGNANCMDCGPGTGKQTVPVKSYKANPFGLYDMAGNAAEWIEDCWNPSYRGAPRDGSAWETGTCDQRVLRGGSFDSSSAYIKPSARFRYDSDVRYWANGFRVVRNIP